MLCISLQDLPIYQILRTELFLLVFIKGKFYHQAKLKIRIWNDDCKSLDLKNLWQRQII